MIVKFIRNIKYKLNPPKKGDVYYGDPLFFVMGRPVEYVLHSLVNKNGDHIFKIVPSPECYRLTIENDSMPYYIVKSEVFCTNSDSFLWKERIQARRIKKDLFKEMVLEGQLIKEKMNMNKLLLFFGLVFCIVCLPSCAHNQTVRVKNCKAVGADMYDCEVISEHNYESHR
jgi:hypothetical protein